MLFVLYSAAFNRIGSGFLDIFLELVTRRTSAASRTALPDP